MNSNNELINKIRSVSKGGNSRSNSGVNTNKTKRKRFSKKASIILIFFSSLLTGAIYITSINSFNKGVDFAGGIVVETNCKNCDKNKIKNELEVANKTAITMQESENGLIFKATAVSKQEKEEKMVEKFKDILLKNNVSIIGFDYASPQMTKTFIDDSIFACIFAFVCIGIYMIIRFNWRFALAGILALSSDVVLTTWFINIAQTEFCLMTLTAMLTIIGYCINDKIVVFDSIRENLKFNPNKSIPEIITISVRSVLTRSVLTSLTTIIVAISLLFFGDKFIYEFGLVVIFGIIVGTISSLTFAPSLLLLFGVKHIEQTADTKEPMFYAS